MLNQLARHASAHDDQNADDLPGSRPKILGTKLSAPNASASHLARARLLAMIDGSATARLILLRAAAGFGKTTLLQQYRDRCIANGRATLWLNLDSADNDLQRLVTHLEAGLLQSGLIPDSTNTPLRSTMHQMEALLEHVASYTGQFSILFDEFEAIQNPSVLNFIQLLLGSLPPGGLMLIASRTTPDIGLGRIRARGHLLDINPSALRFTLEEATSFIRERCQLSLRDNDIATLHRCTEGWITAIYLATLSLQGRSDPAAFVSTFSGTNLELAEYLTEDILASQSDECRLFLLQTSVLKQLNVELCDAVTGRTDSQAMIDHLERANLFIFPVDNQHQWFRYHNLFASYLRDALDRHFPGQAALLHHKASHWYRSIGRPVPAIEHLLQANATTEAACLLAEHIDHLMDASRFRLLMRWLDQIPTHSLDRHPNVGLAYAWTLAVHRRYQDAMKIVVRLEVQAGDDKSAPLAIEAETIRCLLLALTDQVQDCYVAGLKQIERLPPGEFFQYSIVTNTLAFSMLTLGRYEEARRLLSRAIQRDAPRRTTFMSNLSGCIEGVLDLIQGRLGNALARLQSTVERNQEYSDDKAPGGMHSLLITLALALYEIDALDETGPMLEQALPNAKGSSLPDSLITSHILLARIALLHGERNTWLRHLADLEQIGRQSGSTRVVCSSWLERARVATLENRQEAAAQALRSAELAGDWEQPGILFYGNDVDTPFIARLRLRIVQGECAESAELLREAIAQAQNCQQYRRALKLQLLHALALDGLNRQADAYAQLTEALRFASHEGFVRSFLDEGSRLAELIQRWAVQFQARSSSLGIEPRFLARLLQRAGNSSETVSATVGDSDARESLTAREIQVIHLLAAGMRNRAIAEKMFLSEFTVKSHLRNINAKLGAQGRTEAVAIARARGLLD